MSNGNTGSGISIHFIGAQRIGSNKTTAPLTSLLLLSPMYEMPNNNFRVPDEILGLWIANSVAQVI